MEKFSDAVRVAYEQVEERERKVADLMIPLDISKYVTGDVKAFCQRTLTQTVIEYNTMNRNDALNRYLADCLRWGVVPHSETMMQCIPDPKPERKLALVQYFAKTITIPQGSDGVDIIDDVALKVASTIERLYSNNMIFLGFLLKPSLLPLAPFENDMLLTIPKDGDKKFAVIFFVPAVPCEEDKLKCNSAMERLNQFLGNRAFMCEGEVGDSDWSGL